MADATPIKFRWGGNSFLPTTPYQGHLADKHFVVGEVYDLVEHHARSHKSHAHYFSRVHDAWQNLPEDLVERFPTKDHLRKYALIKAGYSDSNTLVCASKADARRTAAFLRPVDSFSVVSVAGNVVTRYSAKSQSERAMGRTDFQASKDAVLGILAQMVGTTRKALEGNNPA